MIEREEFDAAWAILEERFGRAGDFSTPTRELYHRSLSERMDTETFKVAARRVFESNDYFPKPDDFLEAVELDPEAEALREWETVQRVVRGRADRGELSPEARRVVGMMGGVRELGMTPTDEWHFRRREFLRLYGHARQIEERERKELPPMTEKGRKLIDAATEGEEAVRALAGDEG